MADVSVGYIVVRPTLDDNGIHIMEVFDRFSNGEIVTSLNVDDVGLFEHKQMAEDVAVRLNEELSDGWMVLEVLLEDDDHAN